MILIMLGAPGTGKGTVAGILSKELGIVSVSSGDIFRKAISEKTELGKEVEEYLAKGALVPDELTIRVIEARLLEPDLEKGVILDGFPRTTHQAEELEKFLSENGKAVTKVINLVTPEE
jgi:adenylate kinase